MIFFLKKIRVIDRFIIVLFMSLSIGLGLFFYYQNYSKDFIAELELVYKNSKSVKDSVNVDEEIGVLKNNDIFRKVILSTSFLSQKNTEKEINEKMISYRENINIKKGKSKDSIYIKTRSQSGKTAVLMATALVDAYIDFKEKEILKFNDKAKFALSENTESLMDQIKEEQANLEQLPKKLDAFEVGGKVKTQVDNYINSGDLDIMSELMTLDESLKNIESIVSQRAKNKLLDNIYLKESFAYSYFQYVQRNLLDLEFDKFLLLQNFSIEHDTVKKKELAIRHLKEGALEFLKKSNGHQINPEDELDFSLFMRQMSVRIKKQLYVQLMKKQYVDKDSMDLNQIEFFSLKKSIAEKIAQYNLSLKELNQQKVKTKSMTGQTIATVRSVSTPSSRVPLLNFVLPIVLSSIAGLLVGGLFIWFRINYKRQTSIFSIG